MSCQKSEYVFKCSAQEVICKESHMCDVYDTLCVSLLVRFCSLDLLVFFDLY